MLIAAVFVPSPPLLVPELLGLAAAETDELRHAVLAAARVVGDVDEWIVVGTGTESEEVPSDAVGTFRGYGADVRISLGPAGDPASGSPDVDMPLTALIAGWLRERAAPGARAEVHVLARDTDPAECAQLGKTLRAQLDEGAARRGLLIVADGAATLTAKAPGAFDERSAAVEQSLGEALAAGTPQTLAALDAGLCADIALEGRAAWQVLAAAFAQPPSEATIEYSAAPYGVGYHVGTWRP
ncbi:hypothetical protein HCA61_14045 [Rhodococcus sp. HNM0563]|uniref:hypothetical protein n=1 Tax=Rhodococcus sp. HNM0563 TaxID=2716339 RepID=UPI00146BB7D3|nr:hypothetical protein [Rhodococcus sp. HNM0563]